MGRVPETAGRSGKWEASRGEMIWTRDTAVGKEKNIKVRRQDGRHPYVRLPQGSSCMSTSRDCITRGLQCLWSAEGEGGAGCVHKCPVISSDRV